MLDDMPRQLMSHEVAALFGVHPKTVTKWAKRGRLSSVRTPGGHRLRYLESEVRELLSKQMTPRQSSTPS